MDSHKELTKEIPTYASLECSIHKLPFDTIHDIFRVSNDQGREVGISIAISQVCRRWREYALNIPTMWTFLEFTRAGLKQGWAKQKVFLERSKDAALRIEIRSCNRNDILNASAVAQILRLLIPHIHRWKTFRVYLHIKMMKVVSDRLRRASAPALETLRVGLWDGRADSKITKWRCYMFIGGIPNLRTWTVPLQIFPPPSMVYNMVRVREVEVYDTAWGYVGQFPPKPKDIVEVLSRFPNLERLVLHLEDPRDVPHAMPIQVVPISLPNLVSLHFRSRSPSGHTPPTAYLIQICSYIHAPRIRFVEGTALANSFIPLIGSFNPFPSLQTLRLRNQVSPRVRGEYPLRDHRPQDIQNAFLNLSLLSNLVFQHQHLPEHVLEILQQHCPLLTHLALDACIFDMESLIQMVKARQSSQSVLSIERLTILTETPSDPSEQDFVRVRGNGLELITNSPRVKESISESAF